MVARLQNWAAQRAKADLHEADGAEPGNVGPPVGPGAHPLLRPLVAYLLESEAALTLINLEDLFGETRPQNLPGTGADWGNWRRRIAR
jgi:4-alpha-glucanotransferase